MQLPTSVEGIGCSNLLASFSSTSLGDCDRNWAASCSKRNPHLSGAVFMHLIRIAIPTIILLGLSRRGLGAGGDGVSFHGTSHHFQDAIMADPASWTRRVGSSS